MNKKGFTACQIKDLFARCARRFARNGGKERLRLDGFALANPSAPSTPSVGLLSQSACALSSSFAFTLAEVLITLAIIGVVAALTIPTVVRNYQKQQTVVQLKKIYSVLANTTNLAIADNGPITGWNVYNACTIVPGENIDGAEHFVNTYLIPYLKVSKNCGTKTTGDCDVKFSYLNSKTYMSFGACYAKFFLQDGAIIIVRTQNDANYIQGIISVDINGHRQPNKYGKDMFFFLYALTGRGASNGKFIPYGGASREALLSPEGYYACNKEQSGLSCAALIMKDSWHISDDYPW